MGEGRHSKQIPADGIHGLIAYEYANEAARLAATGFDARDIYKVAIDLDTNYCFILIDYSPITWIELGNSAISPQLNKVQVRCLKSSPGTLSIGTVVYVVGWDSINDVAFVESAKADSPSTLPAAGIISEQCTDSVIGRCMQLGVIHETDTSAFVQGLPIYVSSTVAGEFVQVAPSGPYVTQALGVILNVDATLGHIGVNILGYRAYDYSSTPGAVGASGSAGTSNLASPADHVHAHGSQTTATDHAVATTGTNGFLSSTDKTKLDGVASGAAALTSTAPVNVTKAAAVVGVGTTAARHDHKHDVTTAAPGATGVATSPGEGTSTTLARSDHTHQSNTAPSNVTKAAAVIGTSGQPARADHKHDVTTAAPGVTGVSSSSGEGSATSLARSDHSHQSNTSPASVTKAASSVGTSGEPARADHKHDVTTAAASAQVPGDVAAEGVATSLSRADHKHSLPTFGTGVGTFCQGNDSRLSDARTPTAHATSHKSGGADSIKLDELAAPTDITTLNATTGQHGLLPKLGGGTTNFLRADGTWQAPTAAVIFGSQFQQDSSDGESTTTSGTYQQKLRVTTPSLPAGTYRIGFNYEWGKTGVTDFASRVQVNDTTNIMEAFEEAVDAGSDQYFARGGFGYYTGSGVLNIDLDYHSGGSDTARIRRARLEIWRVS